MQDKTSFGPSDELCEYIEEIVKEVVLEGKSFENHKKYFRTIFEADGINCDIIEKNLVELFRVANELRNNGSNSNERLLVLLGKECYLSEEAITAIVTTINEERIKLQKKEDEERKLKEETEKKKEEEERRRKEEALRIEKERVSCAEKS